MTPLLRLKFLINFSCLYQKNLIHVLPLWPPALVILKMKIIMDQNSYVQILNYVFSFLSLLK